MLQFTQKIQPTDKIQLYNTVTLTLEQRLKSRLRVELDNGEVAGILLARGQHLHRDDILKAETGECIQIKAANEYLSIVDCQDHLLLIRAGYHLGNRHVALQIQATQLCYLHDAVLDKMLEGLGLQVYHQDRPFEPESGAYGHNHEHGH